MIFTLLWPIIPFLLQIGVLAYYIASAVYPFLGIYDDDKKFDPADNPY